MVEALVGGHPRDMKKGYITGVGCLREYKNTEFVWQRGKQGFVKAVVSSPFCHGDERVCQESFHCMQFSPL